MQLEEGEQAWRVFLTSLGLDESELAKRIQLIQQHLKRYEYLDSIPEALPEYGQLQAVKAQVLDLLSKADVLAAQIRQRQIVTG